VANRGGAITPKIEAREPSREDDRSQKKQSLSQRTPDEALWTEGNGGMVAGRATPFRQAGDNDQLSALGHIDQSSRRQSIRNGLGKRSHFLLRDELIAGGTQFGQHDKIGLSFIQFC